MIGQLIIQVKFFISYKNTTDIIPKKYKKYTKKNQIKGGKKTKLSKKKES